QFMLAEVVVAQLEQGLAGFAAKADDGSADERRCPVGRANAPGLAQGGQLAGGGLVEDEGGVWMLLEEAGGDGVGDRSLDGPLDDWRFVLAERHDDDLAGFEDGADAHRQRLLRHVLLAEEAAGGVAARHRIERHEPGTALPCRTGFVEADMTGTADA